MAYIYKPFYSIETLRERLTKVFPYLVNVDEMNKNIIPAAVITESEEYKWCVSQFGANAFNACSRGWRFDTEAKWDHVRSTFFFREEKDAALFKVFWYA